MTQPNRKIGGSKKILSLFDDHYRIQHWGLGLKTKMYNPENSKGQRTWEWISESIGGNETQKREFWGNIA